MTNYIPTPKNFKLLNPGSLDGWFGPYADVAAACLAIPNTTVDGLSFRLGKVAGITTTDGVIDYHWPIDFSDAGLIKKQISIKDLDKALLPLSVFEGTTISTTFKSAILDISIFGYSSADNDVVYISSLSRNYLTSGPKWRIAVSKYSAVSDSSTVLCAFESSTVVEPTADNLGRKIMELIMITKSGGVTGKCLINWAAVTDGVLISNTSTNRLRALLSPFTYSPSLAKNLTQRVDTVAAKQLTDEADIISLGTNKLDKTTYNTFITKSTLIPNIVANPDYTFSLQTNVGRERTWYFAKSVKNLKYVGAIFYKNLDVGAFTTGARLQILVKKISDGTSIKILDKTLTLAEIIAYNTSGIIGGYKNYEKIIKLDIPYTTQIGDIIFFSKTQQDILTRISCTVDVLSTTGEWNDGAFTYREIFGSYSNTTYSTVPDYAGKDPRTDTFVPYNFYDASESEYSLKNFDDRITTIEGGGSGIVDFEFIAPKIVFSVGSYNQTERRELVSIYVDHCLKDKYEDVLINGAPELIGNKAGLHDAGVPRITAEVSAIIGGGAFKNKGLTYTQRSVVRDVLKNAFPKHLLIGASTNAASRSINGSREFGAGKASEMLTEISMKNEIDDSGYKYLSVGTKQELDRIPNLTYKSVTRSLRCRNESVGGWTLGTWLNHPVNFSTDVVTLSGGWSLLGFTGTYSNNDANNWLINTTPFGAATPIINAAAYNALKQIGKIADLGTWTGSAPQIAAVQAWLTGLQTGDGQDNKFFDITKSGSNRFSISKYVGWYRTMTDAGVRLSSLVGAGTKIDLTTLAEYDVCLPTDVTLYCSQNDLFLCPSKYAELATLQITFATEIRAQLNTANIYICGHGYPGPMFNKYYPAYKPSGGRVMSWHLVKWNFTKSLQSKFGTITEMEANKLYNVETYFNPIPTSEMFTKYIDGYHPNQIFEFGIGDNIHNGYFGNRGMGSMLYAALANAYSI